MSKELIQPPMPLLIKDLGMLLPTEASNKKRHYGLYKCFCGKTFRADMDNVKSNNTMSCGCYKQKLSVVLNTTHGMTNHKIHGIWCDIIKRCTNKKRESYKNYGGRGITVCDRWLHSFENFRDDMLPTWEEGLTIDRINNDGNYEPSNCRWVGRSTQSRNTRVLYSSNTSGYRGVSFHKALNKWVCGIRIDSKRKHLGYFNTALEAAKAYDTYVVENNLEHNINNLL